MTDEPIGVPSPEWETWLHQSWEPSNVRAMLSLAGCITTAYELIKGRVLNGPRWFFHSGWDETGHKFRGYDRHVKPLVPGNEYKACCAWLVSMNALTAQQEDVLTELHEARKKVVHELPAFLLDPSYVVRPGLLADARECLRSLVIFFVRIDMDTDEQYDGREIADEDISAMDLMVFDQILAAASEVQP